MIYTYILNFIVLSHPQIDSTGAWKPSLANSKKHLANIVDIIIIDALTVARVSIHVINLPPTSAAYMY